MAGNCVDVINSLKVFLNDKFKIKDMGKLKYFLGIEMARSQHDIQIC